MLVVKGVSEFWYDSRPTSKPCSSSLFFPFPNNYLLEKHRHSFTKTQHERRPARPNRLPCDLPPAYAWRLAYLCYVQGYGADDACEPPLDSTSDLSKFEVIVRHGTCTS